MSAEEATDVATTAKIATELPETAPNATSSKGMG